MTKNKKEITSNYFLELREEIIAAFQKLDNNASFTREKWHYLHEGGGEMAVLRGQVFEKAAVNYSSVSGPTFPLKDESAKDEGAFSASGISLITHMANPKAPTVHMNLRFIETEKSCWFGGGYDLTPMGFEEPDDTKHFHQIAKKTLDPIDPDYYPQFSNQAAEYFFIPHRKKERGVGGIFFDHFYPDFETGFKVVKAVGDTFLEAIIPILERRIGSSFTEQEREIQLEMRAHYVEFNLLYDRGTRFGFLSKGNPKAILCSMPPIAKW